MDKMIGQYRRKSTTNRHQPRRWEQHMTEMQRVVLALAKARAELQRDTPASECLDMLRSLFRSWKLDDCASSLKQNTRRTTLH
jgi:hypothetical protein